jgi:hypothetical protein
MQMILYYFKHNNELLASVLFQAKRSGDWLQALSCLDLNRSYSVPLNGKMILVTHDRILLWYALFMGIHVAFTCLRTGEEFDDNSDDVHSVPFQKASGPEKLFLYFNPGNKEDPGAKLQRYRTIVSSLNLDALFIAYFKKYNGWIDEIVRSIETQIGIKDEEIVKQASGTSRTYLKKTGIIIKEILQLFWKLVSISYEPLVVPIKPTNIETQTIGVLDKYLSDCDKFNRIMKKIENKETIISLSENFLFSPAYTNIVYPYKDMSTIAESSEDFFNIHRYVSHIQFRLPSEKLGGVINYLDKYIKLGKDSLLDKSARTDWVIEKMLSLFTRHDEQGVYDSVCKYLKSIASEVVEVEDSGGGGGGASAAAAEGDGELIKLKPGQGAGEETESTYIKQLDKVEEAEYQLAGEEIKTHKKRTEQNELIGVTPEGNVAEADVRLQKRKEKRIYTFYCPLFTQTFASFLAYREKRSEMEGGGNDIYFYPLFLNYLYTLMNAIVGFDSGGVTDYIFYEKLASIVICCIKPVNNDYEELLSVVYYLSRSLFLSFILSLLLSLVIIIIIIIM